jgi:hypothetical protein
LPARSPAWPLIETARETDVTMTRRTIFYLCYDHQNPTGGQKHTYQHVDVLTQSGYSAFVVHKAPGVRLTWFANETPVMDYASFLARVDSQRDFVVVPEDMGVAMLDVPGRKVIFNKNIFTGFQVLGLKAPASDPYRDRMVVAAFVVSAHNAGQLRYAYPDMDVYEVTAHIQPETFRFVALTEKEPFVAAIAKTRVVTPVFQIARARAESGHASPHCGEWVFIRQASECETAAIMARALVFVFLSAEEGLGRMALEAALSGCVVVAYDHGPLRGLLPPCGRAAFADPSSAVRAIERVMAAWPSQLAPFQAEVCRASEAARAFSACEQRRTVCSAWESIFQKHS